MGKQVWAALAIVGVFVVLMIVRGGGGTAERPALFAPGLTLAGARAASAETGKPVFALVTADWCAPCQALKRGALSDPEVAAYLREFTIPVYLDEANNMDEIAALGTRAYPTTYLLRGEETIAQIEGGGSPAVYLRSVRRAIEE
jgi:thiol:disulfide interchange protein